MTTKNALCLIPCAPFILLIGVYFVALYAFSLAAVSVIAIYDTFS